MRALLLPGLDGTGSLFGPLSEALAERGIEARALGYPCDQCLSYDALTARVLRELPPPPYILVGESFSGPIALRVARARPEGLRGVVLAASFVKRPVPRLVGPFARLAFSLPAPGFGLRWVLAGGDAEPALVASLQAALARVPARVLSFRLRQILDLDARADLEACPVPLLYLAAEGDRLVSPRTGLRLQRRRRDLRLVTLSSPHLVLQRQARAAAEAISEFARDPGPSRGLEI